MVDADSGSPFTAKRSAIEDVAATAVMRFIDGLGEYERVSTRAVIGAGREEGVATADSPLVLDFDRGTAATERLLRSASDGRESITFRLPRSATHVRPGIILPVRIGDTELRPMMVERVVEGEDKQIEARSFNQGGYAPTGGVFRPTSALGVRGSSVVLARFLDLPILPGSTAEEWDTLVAFHSDPWPGGVTFAKSPDGTGGFIYSDEAPLRTAMGETLSDLPPGNPALWQRGEGVVVKLFSGTLVGRPEIDVLAGLNALAIEHAGGWEVLQFTEAQLVGPSQWRLTGLLRGRLGTEVAMGAAPLPSGAAVVALDTSLSPLGLEASEVGVPRFYRIGPTRDDVSLHQTRPHTGQGIGRRPYAPCHLRATQSGGDVDLYWIRRTREDGEADWRDGVTDVPLGEASERYAVEVVKNGTVARSVEVTSPAFTYAAADISADGIAAPYTLRVAQVSETYGPGAWASLDIS